jgi:hypothetical protein
MTAARPVPRPTRRPALTSEPRISTRGAIAVFLAALLVVVVGVALYRNGSFAVHASPPPVDGNTVVHQPEYDVTVPVTWLARSAPDGGFDAVYSIPDAVPVSVGIVDFADAALSDPAQRNTHLAFVGGFVAGMIDPNATLTDARALQLRGRHAFEIDFTATGADGTPAQLHEFLVTGRGRAVIVVVAGSAAGVHRHVDAAKAAAATVRFR